MKRPLRLPFLLACAAQGVWPVASVLAAPEPLEQAVFTEVVNDVQVVSPADRKAVKASANDVLRAPDLVKTGRKSRAQLTAPDGTITRVGSSSVFHFDRSSRTINLESGSVLFHSPTGKGGGSIVTNAATAAVVGTTIIVAATADGGFKLLILEGEAKVTYPDGTEVTLKAGQMTFVRPAGGGRGAPGPVLNFDLAALRSESGLIGGFREPLPSAGKIRAATLDQRVRIASGDLVPTGLVIVGAAGEHDFLVVDSSVLRQASDLFAASSEPQLPEPLPAGPTPQERLLSAAELTHTQDGAGPIPETFVFRTAVALPESLTPAGTVAGDNLTLRGVAAGDLTVTGGVFDLTSFTGDTRVDVIGFRTLSFGSLEFRTAPGVSSLRVAGDQLLIADNSVVLATMDAASAPTKAEFIGYSGVSLTGVSLSNPTGSVLLTAQTGDLSLAGGGLTAGGGATASPAVSGDVVITGRQGAVTLASVTVGASGQTRVNAAGDLGVTGSTLGASGPVRIDVGGASATFDATTLSSGGAMVLNATGTMSGTGGAFTSAGDMAIAVGADFHSTGTTLTSGGKLSVTGPGGGLANEIRIENAMIDAPVSAFSATTVAFLGDTFAAGSQVTITVPTGLYQQIASPSDPLATGKFNAIGVQLGGVNIFAGAGLVWAPEANLGDVTAPVHVLKSGVADFRGTKVDYAKSHDLVSFDPLLPKPAGIPVGVINLAAPEQGGLPNSHVFTAAETLSYADFGLTAEPVLPFGEQIPYETTGLIAKNLTFYGSTTLDLTTLENAGLAHTDLVATGTWSMDTGSSLTVSGLLFSNNLNVRAGVIDFGNGSSFTYDWDLAQNPDQPGSLAFLAFGRISGNGVSLSHVNGDLKAVALTGDITLTAGFSVLAGADDAQGLRPGTVALRAFGGNANIALSTGNVRAHVDVNNVGDAILLDSANVNLSGVDLLVRAYSAAGTVNYGKDGEVVVPAGEYAAAGAIRIIGATSVSIVGGKLMANDIHLGTGPALGASVPETLAVNNVEFQMGATAGVGIRMEALTINLQDLTFPDRVQVRLNSRDGVLNVGSSVIGAVNFVSNVNVRDGANLVDLTSASGINSHVWVEGGTILYQGAAMPGATGTTGATPADAAALAPVHIRTVGADNLPDGKF